MKNIIFSWFSRMSEVARKTSLPSVLGWAKLGSRETFRKKTEK